MFLDAYRFFGIISWFINPVIDIRTHPTVHLKREPPNHCVLRPRPWGRCTRLVFSVCNGRTRTSLKTAQRHKPGLLQISGVAFSLLDSALELHSALVDPVFLNDLAVMEHVELLSGVLASKHHDGLLPARVFTSDLHESTLTL